jgi:4-hydroxybenzoate polyprenyltransferase
VPIGTATGLAVLLVVVALALAVAVGPISFLLVAVAYFVMNLAYSFKLKNVAYVDVTIIATGFVLRVIAGGFATHIEVSHYLLACTALLALFLGFGKRRHEIAIASDARKQRASLEAYSPRGLDLALGASGALTLVTYAAYTLDPHTREIFRTDWLWPSTGLVAAAMYRFLVLVRTRPKAESPTQEMLRDGPFVAIVLIWLFLVLYIVYNLRPAG